MSERFIVTWRDDAGDMMAENYESLDAATQGAEQIIRERSVIPETIRIHFIGRTWYPKVTAELMSDE